MLWQLEMNSRKGLLYLLHQHSALSQLLFWNDAIKAFIQSYIPTGNSWPYMMVSAVIVTIIAVIAIVMISRHTKSD